MQSSIRNNLQHIKLAVPVLRYGAVIDDHLSNKP